CSSDLRTAVLRMRAGLTTEYFPEDLLRSKAKAPDWSVTAQILRDIRDLAAARKVPTLFFLIPAPYQGDTAAFRRALRGFKVDPAGVLLRHPEIGGREISGGSVQPGRAARDARPRGGGMSEPSSTALSWYWPEPAVR